MCDFCSVHGEVKSTYWSWFLVIRWLGIYFSKCMDHSNPGPASPFPSCHVWQQYLRWSATPLQNIFWFREQVVVHLYRFKGALIRRQLRIMIDPFERFFLAGRMPRKRCDIPA